MAARIWRLDGLTGVGVRLAASGEGELDGGDTGGGEGVEELAGVGLGGGGGVGVDGVGVGEVVVVVDVRGGEDGGAGGGDAGSADGDVGGDGSVEVGIDHGEGEEFGVGGGDGRGATEASEGSDGFDGAGVAVAADGDRCVGEGVFDGWGGELGADGLGTAVGEVHLEDVEGGGEGELVLLREHEGVDAVDGLGNVGDGDLIGVALEDVQGDAGEECVAHGGLLGEVVVGAEFGALAIPGTPLVDDELDLGLVGGVAHGGPVVGDDALHDGASGEEVVVVVGVEAEGVSGGELGGAAGGVVVDGESPEVAALGVLVEGMEETAGPVGVVSVGAYGDEAKGVLAEGGSPGGVAAELGSVLFGGEVSAASPGLVAYAPEVYVEGVGVAVGGALCGEGIRCGFGCGVGGEVACGGVAVLDLLVEVAGGEGAEIGGEIGLGADGSAGVHELVEAVLVGVLLAPEGSAGGTLVAGADAVAPVVGVGEAAAGPAEDGCVDGAHGVEEGGADAVLVGDGGAFADPDAVVDDSAEVLDEVGVDLGGDGGDGLSGEDLDGGVGVRAGLGEEGGVAEGDRGGGEGGGFEEGSAGRGVWRGGVERHRKRFPRGQGKDIRVGVGMQAGVWK